MRSFQAPLVIGLLPLCLLGLTGCPEEEGIAARVRTGNQASANPSSGANGVSGGVSSGNYSQNPAASPTPQGPTVGGVVASPLSVVLFPPACEPALSLGRPTQAQLSASAQLSDGSWAGVRWLDRSGGQLSVSAGGAVSLAATASPGVYYVRAQALADPNMYQDVRVEVRSTGELEVTLQ